jgi:Cytochrome c-type biogenesis protein CcmF C-terminal
VVPEVVGSRPIDRPSQNMSFKAASQMIAQLARQALDRGLKGWGLFLIAVGAAIALLALVVSATNSQHSSPTMCPGQTAVFGSWTVFFASIDPAAGAGFTALGARLSVRRRAETSNELRPQLRDYVKVDQAKINTARIDRWNGELSVRATSFSRSSGCMSFDLQWRPLYSWRGYGIALAGLGLLLMLLRPVFGAATATRYSLNVTFVAFVLGTIAVACWLLRSAEPPPYQPFADGPGLIKVRDELLHPGRGTFNRWIIIADAMTRRHHHADAATALRGAIDQDRNDPEAWLAMGDALYAAAGGKVTSAAEYAYDQADKAAVRAGMEPGLVAKAMENSGRQNLAGLR